MHWMKNTLLPLSRFALASAALFAAVCAGAGERVGVYDSRIVAFADFWDPGRQAELRTRMAEGKAAKAGGDNARYEELDRLLAAEQRALHLQVFSTAPTPEAIARLDRRAGGGGHVAGVDRLISKWDEAALRGIAEADRIDVTDLLVRDCPLTEAQRQTMREIAGKKPLPLWRAKLLNFLGRL